MTFLTPALALAGVLGVAIPIIIHLLFRRRRKPIEWAAMRFLLEAFRKHHRRLQIQQLLLLIVRCLVIAVLGFALARPLLQDAGLLNLGGSRTVCLVIDNGMISGLSSSDGSTTLEAHIEEAQALIDSLSPGDRVGVITTARPATAIVDPPTTDHAAVKALLGNLTTSDAPSDLNTAMTRMADLVRDDLESDQQIAAYLFSDFREGAARLDAPLSSIPQAVVDRVTFFATPAATDSRGNTQIVGIDPLRSFILPGAADGSGRTTVRLERHGGALDADITRVRLEGDGIAMIEPVIVNWEPGQSEAEADFLLDFRGHTGETVALTASVDDDALSADNQRHALLTVRDAVRVVLIERREFGVRRAVNELSAGEWIRRALEPYDGSPMEFVDVEPAALSATDLRAADVAVLTRPDLLDATSWLALRTFVRNAGMLIIVPPTEASVHQWTSHLESDLGLPWQFNLETVEYDDPMRLTDEQPRDPITRMVSTELADLVRPVEADRILQLDREHSRARAVLTFNDDTPLLLVGHPQEAIESVTSGDDEEAVVIQERGIVAMLTVATEMSWTNLPSKPLMVPLFHELVRQGLSQIRATQQVMVGSQRGLGVPAAADSIKHPDEQDRVLVDQRGIAEVPLARSGIYRVLDPAGQTIAALPVNIDPLAGRSNTQSQAAVDAWLSDVAPWQPINPEEVQSALDGAESGSPIARMLLFALLALVIAETLMARWFSHAWRDGAGVRDAGLTSSATTAATFGGGGAA